MCLNETCSTVRVGKLLCNMFPIRNVFVTLGCFIVVFFFNFGLEYTIMSVEANQAGFKLNVDNSL
jgi:hypothetical protein